jgi:hypothetical protein
MKLQNIYLVLCLTLIFCLPTVAAQKIQTPSKTLITKGEVSITCPKCSHVLKTEESFKSHFETHYPFTYLKIDGIDNDDEDAVTEYFKKNNLPKRARDCFQKNKGVFFRQRTLLGYCNRKLVPHELRKIDHKSLEIYEKEIRIILKNTRFKRGKLRGARNPLVLNLESFMNCQQETEEDCSNFENINFEDLGKKVEDVENIDEFFKFDVW